MEGSDLLHSSPEPARVLTRAVQNVARRLDVPNRVLARILGCSEASISRLGRTRFIQPGSKEEDLALLLVRLYRSLDAIVGGDDRRARDWFAARNHHLGGVPAELVKDVEGLVNVVQYLDAMRGKL